MEYGVEGVCGGGGGVLSSSDGEGTGNETVTMVQVLRCGGPQLFYPPRSVGALAHAFSRSTPDVGGLSAKWLGDLVEAGLVTTPVDLFRILDVGEDDGEVDGEGKGCGGNGDCVVRWVRRHQFLQTRGGAVRHDGAFSVGGGRSRPAGFY